MLSRLSLTLITTIAITTFACKSFAAEEQPAISLTLTPAAEASPALKYELLPPFLDRRPGNAAPFYNKAFLVLSAAGIDDAQWEQVANWLETAPEELPRDEVRETLQKFDPALVELQLAATRDHCYWDLGIREREDIFSTLLPEIQQFRAAGRMIALKARLEVAAGEYGEAVRTLQVGYALARDVSAQPFLISGLVAVAIARQMSEQLETLIAAPDAPNMYWAIAALPRPLIDPRSALEFEGSTLFLMFPELQDIEDKQLTPHEWRQLWRGIFVKFPAILDAEQRDPPSDLKAKARQLALIAAADVVIEKRYPKAKKNLITRGRDSKAIEAMSKSQVVAIDEVETFKRLRDDMFKWSHMPYWQARERMAVAQRRLEKDDAAELDISPTSLAGNLLPSIGAALESYHTADQRLAALQTIEAIRMHAATHEGQLPKSLDGVQAVPIPVNPYTGQTAEYAVDAKGVATLIMPAPREDRTLKYELRIKK